MKDNFSAQSSQYAQFRPGYPAELYAFLFRQCRGFERVWDCATGNGQMAVELAKQFQRVDATDISENQLKNAFQQPNIYYRLGRAEAPDFPDQSFDLITVGQAAHWFQLDLFYVAALKALKPGGVLALMGYHLLKVNPAVDALVYHFYQNTLAGCWDSERLLVEKYYKTLPFPLNEIALPEMTSRFIWTVDHLLGYLSSWSAVKHYQTKFGHTPLDGAFIQSLLEVWPRGQTLPVYFPVFGRVGSAAV